MKHLLLTAIAAESNSSRYGVMPLLLCYLLFITSFAQELKPGDVIWEFELNVHGRFESSPAIGKDGTIYFGSPGSNVYALNPDGTKKWIFDTGSGPVKSSPAVGQNGIIYIASWGGLVFAIDGETGEKVWEFDTDSLISSSPAIGNDGTVYIGSVSKTIHALNEDGSEKWSNGSVGVLSSSPAIGNNGIVYIGTGHNVLSFDTKTGDKIWKRVRVFGEVWTSPAIGFDGTVYVASDDFSVYALKPDGKMQSILWENRIHASGYNSSPVIGSDGTIYIGTHDSKLYALDGETGERKWFFKTNDYIQSTPAIGSDGIVYFGSYNPRMIYALKGTTGEKVWESKTKGPVFRSSPVIGEDGTLYVGTSSVFGETATFYAVKTSSAGPADSPWPMFGQNAQRTGRAPSLVPPPLRSPSPTKLHRHSLFIHHGRGFNL